MKITTFNRQSCRVIDDAIQKALKVVEEEFGVSIKAGGGTFTDNYFTTKITTSIVGGDGQVFDKKAEDYKLQAGIYGLGDIPLGSTFVSNGLTFKITGLNVRARKTPIIAKCIAGGSGDYRFEASKVLRLATKEVA